MFGVIQGEGHGNPEQVVLFENETAAEAYALSQIVMNFSFVFGLDKDYQPQRAVIVQSVGEIRAEVNRWRNAVFSGNPDEIAREYELAIKESRERGCTPWHVIGAVGPSPTIMAHVQQDLNNLTI